MVRGPMAGSVGSPMGVGGPPPSPMMRPGPHHPAMMGPGPSVVMGGPRLPPHMGHGPPGGHPHLPTGPPSMGPPGPHGPHGPPGPHGPHGPSGPHGPMLPPQPLRRPLLLQVRLTAPGCANCCTQPGCCAPHPSSPCPYHVAVQLFMLSSLCFLQFVVFVMLLVCFHTTTLTSVSGFPVHFMLLTPEFHFISFSPNTSIVSQKHIKFILISLVK